MEKFKKNSRVCFLGDSITARGRFIAQIYDWYVKNLPQNRVLMYNCGISGGSAGSGIKYLDYDVLPYDPTDVVIMLGMNDINRGCYINDAPPEFVERRDRAFDWYCVQMTEIAEKLASRGIRLTFCTPTPYDEGLDVPAENFVGCAAALTKCGEFCRGLAEKYGGEVVDFNKALTAVNRELQASDPTKSLIGGDRVHPTLEGHCAMARYFLHSQGFEIEEASAAQYLRGETPLPLSDAVAEWFEIDGQLRSVWNVEWLLLQSFWGKSDAEKLEFISEYVKKGDFPGEFWENIAQTYLAKKSSQQLLTLKLVRLGAQFYY